MELRKIVVGVDFSTASDAATSEAVALAHHTGAELVLVHVGAVLDSTLGDAPAGLVAEWEQVLHRRTEEDRGRLATLRDQLAAQDVDVSTEVVDGYPDSGLVDAAKKLGAELIVIGSHGRSGLRRLLLGSITEKVVRLADACVLVSRPGGNYTGGYHHLLVPTDFSAHAEEALRMARTLAAHGAIIDLVHYWQLQPITFGYEGSLMAAGTSLPELRQSIIQDAERACRDLVERYQRDDMTLRWELVENGASHGIADRAREDGRHYDVIVMGSHGRRGFRRLMLGSTAEATVRHAPCSVMVVHRKP